MYFILRLLCLILDIRKMAEEDTQKSEKIETGMLKYIK